MSDLGEAEWVFTELLGVVPSTSDATAVIEACRDALARGATAPQIISRLSRLPVDAPPPPPVRSADGKIHEEVS